MITVPLGVGLTYVGRNKQSVSGDSDVAGNDLQSYASLPDRLMNEDVRIVRLPDRNDFDADVQFDPDSIRRIHGLAAHETQHKARPVTETQTQPSGIGFEACGQYRIFGQEGDDLQIRSFDFSGELGWRVPITSNPRQHFGKIDARHTSHPDDLGDNVRTWFIEHVGQQRRRIQNAHSRSASWRRSAMKLSTTLRGG